ncbi:MAG: hypothetical protein ACI8Q6_003666 [Granulosicoccus sp.]|jgi:hypothetical protein
MPSQKGTKTNDGEAQLKDARAAIISVKEVILEKKGALSIDRTLPNDDLASRITDINERVNRESW